MKKDIIKIEETTETFESIKHLDEYRSRILVCQRINESARI